MIAHDRVRTTHVDAKVEEVLPRTGLAYVIEEPAGNTWAVTRATPGLGLDRLSPGQRLDLTVVHHDRFSFVSAYAAMD